MRIFARIIHSRRFSCAVAALFALAPLQGEEAGAMEPTPNAAKDPAAATVPGAAPARAARPPARIIVKYRDAGWTATSQAAATAAESLSARAGVRLRHVKTTGGGAQVIALDGTRSAEVLQSILERIRQDPAVEYAEPDAVMTIQQVVDDPGFPEQWHYQEADVGINLPPAWEQARGDGVVVAVLDTGILPHADIAAHVLPGRDLISDVGVANDGDGRDADASDPGDWVAPGDPCYPSLGDRASSWHGLHVAGTIAAVTDNARGVAGIARDASILPVRVLGKCGGFLSDITDGMRWAAGLPVPGLPNNPNRAKVLNLSLGGAGACGPTYADAISTVRAQGATVVVAAGNADSDAADFRPANCEGVITVAATNREGGRSFFGRPGAGSNFGSVVEIAAPGGETHTNRADGILSTLNTGLTRPAADSYAFYQGTSMATPHVAGAAALLYAAKRDITPDEVLAALQTTAQPFPSAAARPCDTATCGAGILDAGAAVSAVLGARSVQRTGTAARKPSLAPAL
jgi:serine protease